MGEALGWQYLGSDPFGTGNTSAGGASEAISFIVAGASYAQHSAHRPSLVIDSAGQPTVAFIYETSYPSTSAPPEFVPGNSEIFVTRFENDTWVPVGPAVPSGDSVAGRGGAGGVSNSAALSVEPSLAPSGSGVLWMAWRDTLITSAIYVRRWNGTDTWEEVTPGSASGGGIAGPSNHTVPQVRLDANDLPIVAWQNFASGQGVAFILRFDGTDWWRWGRTRPVATASPGPTRSPWPWVSPAAPGRAP